MAGVGVFAFASWRLNASERHDGERCGDLSLILRHLKDETLNHG